MPVLGLPEVTAGDDLAGLLHTGVRELGGLCDGDVLVVSSKVVSKALGLRGPPGSERADLVQRHTVRVVAERSTPHHLTRIVESVAGPVMAAAGLDASNTGSDARVLLLPADPDAAARDLHRALSALSVGASFGLVLSDTAGRPWRVGQTDFALGSHGVWVLEDLRGSTDADGRGLTVTARALADELAAAADLVKGKATGVAAALVRGLAGVVPEDDAPAPPGARSLVRTGPGDWFALGHREAVRSALGAPPGTPAANAVGVPAVTAEPDAVCGDRAVRLALLDHPGAEVMGALDRGYVVRASSQELAGRVAARLEIALAGESVRARVTVESTHGPR